MIKKLITIMVLGNLLTSCSVFSPINTANMDFYQITVETKPSDKTCSNKTAPALQITRMKAATPFDTTNMIYAQAPYKIASYSHNRWASSPNQILTLVMQQYLDAQCIFSNVVSADFMTNAKYRLNTQLITLVQQLDSKGNNVRLSVLAQLVDNSTNTIVQSKTFLVEVPVKANPGGMVDGANKASAEFMRELGSWLAHTTSITANQPL